MDITINLSKNENISYYGSSIITLDFESYLKGVVPAEIGNAHIEACKAQAVAARTFALCKFSKSQQITDKPSIDQCYRVSRVSSQYANALLAVEETAGQVLYYNGKLINNAYYSNSNGGRIYSSEEVWGGVRPYLIAKEDPYNTKPKDGHGVGMSQTGAKQMAKLGFTYKDILQFYYPGTTICANYGEKELRSMSKADIVKQYALSKVGCGYIYGTAGQVLTQSLLTEKIRQYPNYVTQAAGQKWLGKEVFDCAGFVRMCLKQVDISIVAGATSQWKKTNWAQKGTIDTLPKDKVCCLYRQDDSNTMGHTGMYLGDGTIVHASSIKVGVVKTTLDKSKSWTHWGIPAGLYDNNIEVIKVAYQALVTKIAGASGSTVNMRKEASANASVITAIKFGQTVEVTRTVGDWSAIIWNGKSGYMLSKFLTKVENTENKTWYVKVKCNSEDQAKALANLLRQAEASS